jgi:hypothetical protein
MKPRTYARFALLIPFLVWVILLFLLFLINVVVTVFLPSTGQMSFFDLLQAFLLFYIIGILFWFPPYLVLSMTLLFISFKSRLETMKYLFVLSPFAMAMLVMLETAIILIPAGTMNAMTPIDLASTFKDRTVANLIFGALAIVWGYLCVCLGLAGYKLLQHFGKIKEDEKISVEITNVNNQAA